jgi:hypothetical protein
MRKSITCKTGKNQAVKTGEKTVCSKKKKAKALERDQAELRKAYNDGYDGYYEDLLPVDHGKERFETDSAPVKKIIILAVSVLVVIGLCVLMLYFV